MTSLLFLSKRSPQQRCLKERPYGRFCYLPIELAASGYTVNVALLGHAGDASDTFVRDGVVWTTVDLGGLHAPEALFRLRRHVRHVQPDWIIGCSDAWVGVIAHWLARSSRSRLAIDAYDNYESYMPWNIPLHWAWRRAVRAADLSLAAGPQLARLMDRERRGRQPTVVIPMAADPCFVPMDQVTCRDRLDLPKQIPLIGYSGGWAAKRGTGVIGAAFSELRKSVPNACLVLTGHPPQQLLSIPGVIALGYVEDNLMPFVLNAMDVNVVITTHSSFGKYSYPAKLCESLACGTPVVATATDPVRWMLGDNEHALTPVDDPVALARSIRDALASRQRTIASGSSWNDVAGRLDKALQDCAQP